MREPGITISFLIDLSRFTFPLIIFSEPRVIVLYDSTAIWSCEAMAKPSHALCRRYQKSPDLPISATVFIHVLPMFTRFQSFSSLPLQIGIKIRVCRHSL